MYEQSDIRNPDADESLRERRAQVAVEEAARDVLVSRRKSAPVELVTMLHEGEDRKRVWRALSSGMVNRYDRSGSGICLSFAGLCYARGRADILRAIVEAGQPQWMRELPRMDDPRAQYHAHGALLPMGEAPREWLEALTRYQFSMTGPSSTVSLFHIATEPLGKHSAAFLELALDVYPDHADVTGLRERSPEGAALVTQLMMKRHIAAAAAVGASAPTEPAPPPRRLRAQI